MIEVSVILSVYNGELLLRRCLDSLAAQTLQQAEFICVDDGSTDNSLAVLNEYAARDNRFVVIALGQNQGMSRARNTGLQKAKGRFACTLDADDWFSADALELAVSTFKQYPKTDCVMFQLMMVESDTGSEHLFPMIQFDVMAGQEAMKRSLTWNGLHGLYLTHTSFFRDYPFDETTRVYSDENTCRLHFFYAREVRQCSGVYYYWQHAQSITHRVSVAYFDRLRATEHLLATLRRAGADGETITLLANALWARVIDCYFYAYKYRRLFTPAETQHAMTEIKRIWSTIDLSEVTQSKWKFGHMPLRFSWRLFQIEEETYFLLRSLLGRNK